MEKIEEYKMEIQLEIENLKTKDNEEEIKEKVKEYEEKLRKEYEDDKDAKIKVLEIKLECLNELEKREEEQKLAEELSAQGLGHEEETNGAEVNTTTENETINY